MPAASINGDTCVGAITPSGHAIWGARVVRDGDPVASHPPCPVVPIHCSPVTTATSHVILNGINVTMAGDPATCRDPATGSSHVILEPSGGG